MNLRKHEKQSPWFLPNGFLAFHQLGGALGYSPSSTLKSPKHFKNQHTEKSKF